ncbi:DUF3099 domain-containing protein [Natronoglycomyces albus]|uniref:DUF3099 domain-containing protein n=1 Tax=Natronoglycomyces albus TaxID=2811108 RepID=A0A895XS99_9ACTN|nr:DUF3099 domain-containing protein [Natronoglycomyces albus]QSB06383.1 DUF3099 domain-containing protein [Natronoglycomyces albus]
MTRDKATPIITDVRVSPEEQRRARTTKYMIMMGIRVFAVVACGILVIVEAPLLWLWLTVGLVAMAVVPWLAVMLANDSQVKKDRRLFAKYKARSTASEPPALSDSEKPHRTIDAD